jgi:hypothetical protein
MEEDKREKIKQKVLSMEEYIKKHHPEKCENIFELIRNYVDMIEEIFPMMGTEGLWENGLEVKIANFILDMTSVLKEGVDSLFVLTKKMRKGSIRHKKKMDELWRKYERGELTTNSEETGC